MSKNKYQEALNNIENIVLEPSNDGHNDPRTVQDFYYENCWILQELVDKAINIINNQLTQEEIEAILVCMSYYSLRNEGKLVNNIDIGFGGELYSKLLQLSKYEVAEDEI